MSLPSSREQVRRRALPAWGMSLGLHCAVFLLLGLVLRAAPPKSLPAATTADRTVGIVLAPIPAARSQEHFYEPDASPAVAASATPAVESGKPTDATPPPILTSVSLPSRQDVSLADTSARDLIAQPGLRASGRRPVALPGLGDEAILAADAAQARPAGPSGPPGMVSLFGAPAAVGHSFVFVIDRSHSMGDSGLGVLAAAERELLAALARLSPEHKFQIIAYNQKVSHFSDKGLAPATEANRREVRRFFTSMGAIGGTEHEPALLAALRLSPDAIFLFTDGGDPHLGAPQLERIVGRAGSRTTIHCFQFGLGPQQEADNFMQRLADRTRGEYGYIDMTQVRRKALSP